MEPGKASLSLIINAIGGIKDDCIITKVDDNHFYVVLNAGCKDKDMRYFRTHRPKFNDVTFEYNSSQVRSLIAV